MTKKQTNLILGFIITVVAVFAFFFSDDSSQLISFEDIKKEPSQDAYEREVVFGSKEQAVVSEDNVSIETEGEVITEVLSSDLDEVSQGQVFYEVVKVVDGDTVDVEIEGEVNRLRLIGIDTPETVDPRKPIQCFGKEASKKAEELLFGKLVVLEPDESQGERDKYGRLLRYVILSDGTNFNKYMISEGYAHEYTYDEPYKYQTEFKAAQEKAIIGEKGLWNPSTCPN
jgi:endonuclease YncB( thermonuclease family)